MSYPNANAHRRGRRSLGAGQSLNLPTITVTVPANTVTNQATFNFTAPVVLNGLMPLLIPTTITATASLQLSPTQVQQTFLATGPTIVGKSWTMTANVPQLTGFQGQGVAGATGTF